MTADCSRCTCVRCRVTAHARLYRSVFREPALCPARTPRQFRRSAGPLGGAKYGAKAQVGQVAVHRHAAARVHERGDGVQRLGRHRDGERSTTRTCFSSSRRPGRCSACCLRADRHAHRLPQLPAAGGHLDGARRSSALALVAVLFGRPVNGASRWLGIGGARRAAVGAREDRRHRLHRRAARAAHGSHRRGCRTRCCRSASSSAAIVGADPAEPDLGTAVSIVDDRRGDGVRRRHQLPLHRRAAARRRCRRSTSW